MAGVPDNVIPALGIELKTPSGKVSGTQKQLHAEWQKKGVPVIVAHSIQEVLDGIKEHGYIRG